MNAALDQIDAMLVACRADLENPSFRILSEKERRNAFRRDISNLIPGSPIPEPDLAPPSQESEAALAELLEEIRRLEKAAAELRAEESHRR